MSFSIEFTDTGEIVQVEDVAMSDAPAGKLNITNPGNKDAVFAWNKFVISAVTIKGFPIGATPPQIMPRLRAGVAVGVVIRLTNGTAYTGTLGIDNFGQASKADKPAATLTGTFTGRRDQKDEKDYPAKRHGLVIDLHDGTSYTFNCQDIRSNGAVRPFYKDGLADSNTTVPDTIRSVIESQRKELPYQHTHPGDAPQRFVYPLAARVVPHPRQQQHHPCHPHDRSPVLSAPILHTPRFPSQRLRESTAVLSANASSRPGRRPVHDAFEVLLRLKPVQLLVAAVQPPQFVGDRRDEPACQVNLPLWVNGWPDGDLHNALPVGLIHSASPTAR